MGVKPSFQIMLERNGMNGIPRGSVESASNDNLLVPVCFSATHLGYASARMEPVFMICGASGGLAANLALEEMTNVQRIDPARFRAALEAAHQKLTWNPKHDKPAAPANENAQYGFETLLSEGDKDQSGTISPSEWEAMKSGWEWLFPRIDTNGDGSLSKTEYEAFQEYKQTHSDWAS